MSNSHNGSARPLKGSVAFITGGSGAVGQAICRSLRREGARVAFSYFKNAEKAHELERELGGSEGDAKCVHADLRDRQNLEEAARELEELFGKVDILVNNAAYAQVMPFALIEEEDWDLMMDINIKGLFLTTRAFLRGMIRRRQGSIVNVGSLAGLRVMEVPVHYATAKSAVLGFTLSLAREVGRYNIRVNAVIPGLLDSGVGLNVPEKLRKEYIHFCTLSRLGTPENVAELVAFLVSDRASYINAQTIFVDGGI